jgi:hypothetical protein
MKYLILFTFFNFLFLHDNPYLETGIYLITNNYKNEKILKGSNSIFRVCVKPEITIKNFKSVLMTYWTKDNSPCLTIKLDSIGCVLFRAITNKSIGNRIGVIIDNELVMASICDAEIPNGTFIVSGNYPESEFINLKFKLEKEIKSNDR